MLTRVVLPTMPLRQTIRFHRVGAASVALLAAGHRFNSSSANAPPNAAKDADPKLSKAELRPGEGIRSLPTSSVFRTLNFELYARPVS